MGVNKVIVNGSTIFDLTGVTVTPETLAKGVTAHDKSGAQITGTAEATSAEAETMNVYVVSECNTSDNSQGEWGTSSTVSSSDDKDSGSGYTYSTVWSDKTTDASKDTKNTYKAVGSSNSYISVSKSRVVVCIRDMHLLGGYSCSYKYKSGNTTQSRYYKHLYKYSAGTYKLCKFSGAPSSPVTFKLYRGGYPDVVTNGNSYDVYDAKIDTSGLLTMTVLNAVTFSDTRTYKPVLDAFAVVEV